MMEHWREKRNQKIEKKLEDQRKHAEDQARSRISNYTSTRTILKKSVPMIILGLVLAAVEYMLIGAIYTIVSLLIYMPVDFHCGRYNGLPEIYEFEELIRDKVPIEFQVPAVVGYLA